MTTPLERAEQAVAEAREEAFRVPNLPAIDRLIRAVRRHDAEILRAEASEHDCVEWEDAADRLDPDKTNTHTEIVVRYDDGLAVRLTHWELDVYADHLDLEGRIAPGAPVPRVGVEVKVARLEIPARAALADIYAAIALDSDEHPRLKLTTRLEAQR
ncbi:hypothetical protein [Streptomyces sp. ME19-01-6]|uniref:hypothetical protein n=1 Tax=Streptomyces sp. ME19-01-6 TaxID=3028686 RepID=UPI0029B9717F|nr:hypothetical protein [Streptomyces sp. ME19-01-6]MDX3232981.1 hypothetical protein [Streptomyces sp. ME19-01-6]